jgi:hypothetical protein
MYCSVQFSGRRGVKLLFLAPGKDVQANGYNNVMAGELMLFSLIIYQPCHKECDLTT